MSGGDSPLPGPEPEGTLGQRDGVGAHCYAPDHACLPGLPFSSCSTATGSPGGGGSSTRLSSASTRPGRLGGQMPMWSPGWYWSPSWPPVFRHTRIVARLGVGRGDSYRVWEARGRRMWEEEGSGAWEGGGGADGGGEAALLTWTCCSAGFPRRGL